MIEQLPDITPEQFLSAREFEMKHGHHLHSKNQSEFSNASIYIPAIKALRKRADECRTIVVKNIFESRHPLEDIFLHEWISLRRAADWLAIQESPNEKKKGQT